MSLKILIPVTIISWLRVLELIVAIDWNLFLLLIISMIWTLCMLLKFQISMLIAQLSMGLFLANLLMKSKASNKLHQVKIALVLDKLLNLYNILLHILFSKSHQLVTWQNARQEISMNLMEKKKKISSIIIPWCTTLLEPMNLKKSSMEMISRQLVMIKHIFFNSMDLNLSVLFPSMMLRVFMQFLRSTRRL